MTTPTARLLALCLLDEVRGKQWQVIARQASKPGGLSDLLKGIVDESHRAAASLRENLALQLPRLDQAIEKAEAHVQSARAEGAKLVTVLDEHYPRMLASVRDRPPFLFYVGDLEHTLRPAVAVVGTRKPSDDGVVRTRRLSAALTEAGYVIVSGMAAGVDTAAHETALDNGAPTIAVMGTGILRTYPASNAGLRGRIAETGLVLSQFLPDQPPGRHTFPMRNVITSGLAQATVVVEASDTSGARLQARIAAEQGRNVLVLKSLVEKQVWAHDMVASGKATQISSPEELTSLLASVDSSPPASDPSQLRLDAP